MYKFDSFKSLTFEMGIVVHLAGKKSFSPNASTKLNCANIDDFIPNVIQFHHGTDHVYSCPILGFHISI